MQPSVNTLSARFTKLEKKVETNRKDIKVIKDKLGFQLPVLSPLSWPALDILDKKILTLLMAKSVLISTVKLGAVLKEHRGKIWRHLKKCCCNITERLRYFA